MTDINTHISDKKSDLSSWNEYFVVTFESENQLTRLFIWFTHEYLTCSSEAKNINFSEIVNKEIETLMVDLKDKIFDSDKYFVLYRSKGRSVNEKFHPFLNS